jgi:type II secretory pathway component PulF
LRFNLVARWVDVVRIGVSAGLELPAAIALAADATRSPVLRKDGETLSAEILAGHPLATLHLRLLPATVTMALAFSSRQTDLPAMLQTLVELYQRQAELRLERIPSILTPLLVIVIAIAVGLVMCGLLYPVAKEIEQLGRLMGWKW